MKVKELKFINTYKLWAADCIFSQTRNSNPPSPSLPPQKYPDDNPLMTTLGSDENEII